MSTERDVGAKKRSMDYCTLLLRPPDSSEVLESFERKISCVFIEFLLRNTSLDSAPKTIVTNQKRWGPEARTKVSEACVDNATAVNPYILLVGAIGDQQCLTKCCLSVATYRRHMMS